MSTNRNEKEKEEEEEKKYEVGEIVKKAIEFIGSCEKVHPDYLTLCAEGLGKTPTSVTGRLILNTVVESGGTNVSLPVASQGDYVCNDLKGLFEGAKTVTDCQKGVKPLMTSIQNHPEWQKFWNTKFKACNNKKDIENVATAYSQHLNALVYAAACQSQHPITDAIRQNKELDEVAKTKRLRPFLNSLMSYEKGKPGDTEPTWFPEKNRELIGSVMDLLGKLNEVVGLSDENKTKKEGFAVALKLALGNPHGPDEMKKTLIDLQLKVSQLVGKVYGPRSALTTSNSGSRVTTCTADLMIKMGGPSGFGLPVGSPAVGLAASNSNSTSASSLTTTPTPTSTSTSTPTPTLTSTSTSTSTSTLTLTSATSSSTTSGNSDVSNTDRGRSSTPSSPRK